MKSNSMEELIVRVQKGDEIAFNELYQRYHKLVYYIAYEMCHSDADAQDISQETFVQIKKSIGTLQNPQLFKSWLNRIVVNKCKNLFRTRKTMELDGDDNWYKQYIPENRTYMLPKENVHFKSDQELVHYFLNQLSDAQRIVLFLFYFNHMSIKEIAIALEISEGTIKTRLLYGKNNLKRLIEEYEHETDTKVNFHVDDMAISAAFAYTYKSQTVPTFLAGKKKTNFTSSSSIISNLTVPLVAGGLGLVVVTSGVMAYHQYQKMQDPVVLSSPKTIMSDIQSTNARENYFLLMDWACCKEDMLMKSKEEFEKIMPIFLEFKETDSEYLKHMETEDWIADFEGIYEGL